MRGLLHDPLIFEALRNPSGGPARGAAGWITECNWTAAGHPGYSSPRGGSTSRRGDQELGRRAESSLRLGGGPRGLWRETEDAPALVSFGAGARSLSPLRRGIQLRISFWQSVGSGAGRS